jgi:hypothetical protein
MTPTFSGGCTCPFCERKRRPSHNIKGQIGSTGQTPAEKARYRNTWRPLPPPLSPTEEAYQRRLRQEEGTVRGGLRLVRIPATWNTAETFRLEHVEQTG